MDHLPQPQNAFSEYPIVECICAVGNIEDGPINVKSIAAFECKQEQYTTGSITVTPLPVAAPFLQAWLWFGLLERVFDTVGVAFDSTDFVTHDDSIGLRLSTLNLHRFLWYWVAAESQASYAEKKQHGRLINEYIDEVFDSLQCYTIQEPGPNSPQIQDISTFGPFLDDDASNVLLAIVVLAEALDFAQEEIYQDIQEGRGRAWDETLSIRLSLLEAGWCINELSWLTNQLTTSHVTLLLYLTRIDRHIFEKDHHSCEVEECIYAKIDYTTYRPIHTSTGCCCSDVTPRYDLWKQMDLLLYKGSIPLIKFASDDSFGSQVNVQAFSRGKLEMSYVAISHVWSDRLGNLRENALPACQLQRLQNEVNALYPALQADVPF